MQRHTCNKHPEATDCSCQVVECALASGRSTALRTPAPALLALALQVEVSSAISAIFFISLQDIYQIDDLASEWVTVTGVQLGFKEIALNNGCMLQVNENQRIAMQAC